MSVIPPSERAIEVFNEICTLNGYDLIWISKALREFLDGEGGAGVREPVGAPPDSPGDTIALEQWGPDHPSYDEQGQ